MAVTFPGESAEYRAARDRLLDEEIELRRAIERVAAARRALPPGGKVPEDYSFRTAVAGEEPTDVHLSQLFGPGVESVAIYSWMFPRHAGDPRPAPPTGPLADWPLEQTPCPSCTAFLDQLNGAAEHVGQNMGIAIEASVPIERMLVVAVDRGWRHLRFLSSVGTTYRRDYHGEGPDGDPVPILNVFHRDPDGTIRLSWSSEMMFAPADEGQDPRHNGTLEPLWNLFDLTPEGRPTDWNEQLHYD